MRETTPNGTPDTIQHVGTLIGESTSREFRMAVAHEAVREQDIIAVDVAFRPAADGRTPEELRVWAKVQRIERLNPLFPAEAAHELAGSGTNPFETVISLSREMVTAVCRVLGAEPVGGENGGRLGSLRYPPQPVSSAYRPPADDIKRVLIGELAENQGRALDIAALSTRPEIDVAVDGHAIVSRHLAILAMTGAGKSWAARRIIEELAAKNYPIVIFDPHGDYSGLGRNDALRGKVKRFFARFPVFEEDSETVERLVSSLGYPLSPTMQGLFPDVFRAATNFLSDDPKENQERAGWLAETLGNPNIERFGIQADLWLIANLAEAAEKGLATGPIDPISQKLIAWGWPAIRNYSHIDRRSLEAIRRRVRRAAGVLNRMERTNRRVAGDAEALPVERASIVRYGQVSVVSLAGYDPDFQATILSIVADDLFEQRVRGELQYPVFFVLEEAHNFVPSRATTEAEARSIATTRQLAQEGRKFNIGLLLISQRPSRLDETTLAMCNSFIIMRMVNPNDQQFVRRVIESLGEDEARLLPDLDVGEAILSGQMVNFPVLVKMKAPASRGEREEADAFEVLRQAHVAAARPRNA
jgi:hypothetical protein